MGWVRFCLILLTLTLLMGCASQPGPTVIRPTSDEAAVAFLQASARPSDVRLDVAISQVQALEEAVLLLLTYRELSAEFATDDACLALVSTRPQGSHWQVTSAALDCIAGPLPQNPITHSLAHLVSEHGDDCQAVYGWTLDEEVTSVCVRFSDGTDAEAVPINGTWLVVWPGDKTVRQIEAVDSDGAIWKQRLDYGNQDSTG